LYREHDGSAIPATGKVEKLNPRVELVFYGTVMLMAQGDERTAVRFAVGTDGRVRDVNQLAKRIVPLRRIATAEGGS
ncbi:MAG: hypothetical protein ACREIR_23045, partial [Geminicoccaceae bacterium]